MLLNQYDTDFFNIKPKKLKKGLGDTEAPDDVVFQTPDSALPKESDLKPADIPDDFVHNYIMPTIGGVMKFFNGEKAGKLMWDGVTEAVSAIQPSQRGEMEDLGKSLYGTQEWVEVQNEGQLASPEIKKATGNATASNAEGVLTGAESKRNDAWGAEHPTSKFVLTPEGKADKTRKSVYGLGGIVEGFLGEEGKETLETIKKVAGGVDVGIKYGDIGTDVFNATLGSLFNIQLPKPSQLYDKLHPSGAPQVRKKLKQDLGSGMNAFSKWR